MQVRRLFPDRVKNIISAFPQLFTPHGLQDSELHVTEQVSDVMETPTWLDTIGTKYRMSRTILIAFWHKIEKMCNTWELHSNCS